MNRLLQATIGVALTAGTTQLYAAGFYLKEQSIVSQGQAFAGVAAQSGLASSAYFNPAGLATLDVTTVDPSLKLDLAFSHIRADAVEINQAGVLLPATAVTMKGIAESTYNLISIGLRKTF